MQIYNSLSGQKERFHPLQNDTVRLYVCGITVYDFCHIGHARTNATFDTFVRYLRWRGMSVKYVRNITDIDDKIIKRAAEHGISVDTVVAENIQHMHEDFDALNFLRPDEEPRATETIPDMIGMIQTLIDTGFAYVGAAGDVYYDVSKFQSYGKLSKQNLEALHLGIRVEVAEDKKSPLDFVLWKAAKPHEPAWDAPWGKGRPGWHIECSAMTKKCLGTHFDIHGGGADLRFPHHENEIAQSEAANQSPFANYWMHSGMVQVNDEKMSKSLGNFFIIRDVLKTYPPEVLRYFLIAGHYRSEISYSTENLESAKSALTRLYRAIALVPCHDKVDQAAPYQQRFIEVMDEDLNTAEALAVLFDLAREINKTKSATLQTTLKELGGILGILQADPQSFLKGDASNLNALHIENLLAARTLARQNKNFAESDRIRDELTTLGIEIEDTPQGVRWRRV